MDTHLGKNCEQFHIDIIQSLELFQELLLLSNTSIWGSYSNLFMSPSIRQQLYLFGTIFCTTNWLPMIDNGVGVRKGCSTTTFFSIHCWLVWEPVEALSRTDMASVLGIGHTGLAWVISFLPTFESFQAFLPLLSFSAAVPWFIG